MIRPLVVLLMAVVGLPAPGDGQSRMELNQQAGTP